MEQSNGLDAIMDSFEKVTKEQWLQKITADLKGKEVESLSWKFDKDLSISPFANAEDLRGKISDITYDPTWELAEEFDVQSDVESNAEILDALALGTETIMLVVHDIPNWDILLNGVALDMISTYVTPDPGLTQAVVASLEQWLRDNSGDPDVTISVRADDGLIMEQPDAKSDRTAVDVLVKTIQQGISAIEDGYEVEKLECIAKVGDSFFVEVARIRALRILWNNILEATNRTQPSLLVEARFAPEAMKADMHLNMISAGSKTLAAICGGADRIIIGPSDDSADRFSRRISRNIHHIFRMESKLDLIPDPVKGSWYLEQLTAQLVQAAWSQLIKD